MSGYRYLIILLLVLTTAGTANSQIMKYLGLTDEEMEVVESIDSDYNEGSLRRCDSLYKAAQESNRKGAMCAALMCKIHIHDWYSDKGISEPQYRQILDEIDEICSGYDNDDVYFRGKDFKIKSLKYSELHYELMGEARVILAEANIRNSDYGRYVGCKALGFAFYIRDNPRLTKKYLKMALDMAENGVDVDREKANLSMMISMVYDGMGMQDSALYYMRKHKSYQTTDEGRARSDYITLSLGLDMTPKEYISEYLKIEKKYNTYLLVGEYRNYLKAKYFAYMNMPDSAKYYCLLAEQIDSLNQIAEVSSIMGDYKNAFRYRTAQMHARDSLQEEIQNQIFTALEVENNINKLREDNEMHRKRLRYILITLVILALASVAWIAVVRHIRAERMKRELQQEVERQTAKIKSQSDEIMAQRDNLQLINQNTTASIEYAKLIQRAAVPSEATMTSIFPVHTIMWRPLNIVSGDYYWATQLGRLKILAVADCTGHGVPGAFMSMMGMSLLNEMAKKIGPQTKACDILNTMRDEIIKALNQSNEVQSSQDGMDMGLIIVDEDNGTIDFAGANRPLVQIRDGQATVYKPSKMPVGIYLIMKPFVGETIETQPGDWYFMFSDGIQDQFGFDNGERKKFTQKRLLRILCQNINEPPERQSEFLSDYIDEFCTCDSESEPQIDDQLIVGIQI